MSNERSSVTNREVVDAAFDWLCRAHDATGRQGVSAWYDLRDGWGPPYPETSGYIVPTLIAGSRLLDRPDLLMRADEIGRWLVSLQSADGAFPGGTGTSGAPVDFDTGQILRELLELHRLTTDDRWLTAAVRAGESLRAAQQSSGAWLSHLGYENTYSARVTWAMAELAAVTNDEAVRGTVERSLAWILQKTHADGWIDAMAFAANQVPTTHTIGYALRGLLRCADLVGGDLGRSCAAVATTCALRLNDMRTALHPLLPGEIGDHFTARANYACLTGDAQMVVVWLDVASRTGNAALSARCDEVLARLADVQLRQPLEPDAVGALPGSWPLTGAFEPLSFPSWSTKFLADAFLTRMRWA